MDAIRSTVWRGRESDRLRTESVSSNEIGYDAIERSMERNKGKCKALTNEKGMPSK